MSDTQNKIPTFDEVMHKQAPPRGVPSFEDIMGEPEPVKKKVGLNWWDADYQVGGNRGNGKAQSGLPEERKVIQNTITQTKFKKNEHPFDQTKEDAVAESTQKLNDIMFGEGDDWKDPIKAAVKGTQKSTTTKEATKHLGVKTLTEQSLMPDGFEAKKTLTNTLWGEMGNDNLTSEMLRKKAADYDKAVNGLRDVQMFGDPNIQDNETLLFNFKEPIKYAAVKAYAEKHPQFKKELQLMGLDINDKRIADRLPNGKVGLIVDEYMQDPNVFTYATKENPALLPALRAVQENNITDNVDYGINKVANKVSQAVQETGYNSVEPLFNFHDKAHEKVNDDVAHTVLTPQELEIWNKHIKDRQEQYMDEPSFFEGWATRGKEMAHGLLKTFTEPFTPISETIKDKWDKEVSYVSANPSGVSKYFRDVGGAVGLVTSLIATRNLTGIQNPTAGGTAATGLLFFGDMLEQGKQKFPDSPAKAWTSAGLNTAMYMALSTNIFGGKAKSAFESVKPELGTIVENLTAGKITQEVARKQANTLYKQAFDFIGGTLTKQAAISAELSGLAILNRGFDKISGQDDEEFEKYHPDGEIAHTFLQTAGEFLPITAIGKFGEMRGKNRIAEESYYKVATNPKYFERVVDELGVKDPSVNIQEMKSNISFLQKTLEGVKDKSPREQKRYLYEAMKERSFGEKPIEPALAKKHNEAIKESQEIREKILAGENADTVITDAEQKKIDEQKENEVKLQRLQEDNKLDNEKFDMARKGLDGRNPDDKIKIAEIEKNRKRANEDFEKESSKLKPKVELTPEQELIKKALDDGTLKGYNVDMATAALKDPEAAKQFMEMVRQQSHNEVAPDQTTREKTLAKGIEDFGEELVNASKPKSEPITEGTPEEISQPIELNPKLPEGYEATVKTKEEGEGGDVIKDENGKPQVFYRGTDTEGMKSKEESGALFFSPDKDFASNFSGDNGRIDEVNLKVKNTFDYTNPEHLEKAKEVIDPALFEGLKTGNWKDLEYLLDTDEGKTLLEEAGFDSMYVNESKYHRIFSGGKWRYVPLKETVKNIVVLKPEQVVNKALTQYTEASTPKATVKPKEEGAATTGKEGEGKDIWKMTQDESFKVNEDKDSGEGVKTHEEMVNDFLKGYKDGKGGLSIEGNSVVFRNEDGKPVGFAHFDKDGIREIGVDKSERGNGIASKMIDYLKKEKGIDKVLPPFSKEGNILSHRNEVKKAIAEGKYQKAIDNGEMTVDEANKIIKSAGLKAPTQSKATVKEGEGAKSGIVGDKTGLVLYHGSPHSFENFDIAKLGSGEGAQAFGHGLYFTNEVDIAKGYANRLGSKKNFWESLKDGNEISLSKEDFDFIKNEVDTLGFDGYNAEQSNLGDIKVGGKNEFAPDVLEALAVAFGKNAKSELSGYDLTKEQIDKFLEIKRKISDPQLYKIAAHEGKTPSEYDYIDWREPLTDSQRKKIGGLREGTTGEQAYKILSKELDGDQKASEFLLSKGIDGITYKSAKGTGGKTGEGRNYVIFDPKAIRVDEINEQKQQKSGIVEGEVKTEINEKTNVQEPTKTNESKQAEKKLESEEKVVEDSGKSGKEPPTEGGKPSETVEGDAAGITHAATQETTRKAGLPDYEGHEPVTHEQRIAAAKKAIADNPNLADQVLTKVEKGGNLTPQDNAVLAVYKGALDAELDANPSKEVYDRISRIAKVLNPEGTYAGQLLESRKLVDFNEDSLSNFLMGKEAAQGTSLSEAQIKSESAKYTELKEAKEKLEVELAAEKEKYQKLAAEIGVNRAKAAARKASKKSHEEHVKDRKAILEAAKADLKKIREQGLHSTIPGLQELKVLAPHVKRFMQDLLNEGVDKFDNIVSAIHAEFKDVLDTLRKVDVIDILAGDYDVTKEQTRNEKAAALRLTKREAQLTKELAAARKKEEKSKSEKEKTAANRRIDELTEKIKEVKRLNKEKAEELPPTEQKLLSDYIDKLTKKADRLARDIKEKKYLEEKPTPPVFKKSRKAQILEDRVIDLENKIRHERSVDEYRKRSKGRKIFDKIMEVLGIRRLVQSAVDISIPFRQGATLLSPRRIDIWLKGFKANLQSVFSPKKFERIMYEIRHDPMYHDMVKDKVVFNDLGSADPNLHNEDFRKSFIYKIPILSEPLKASNRAADAFLNVARFEIYKKMRAKLEMQGFTREANPEEFKYIGNWAMSMTGRGRMTNMLENSVAHTVLGNTFYGARLMASRFNLLNPVTYFDPRVSRAAKVEAMKDMAAFTVTVMSSALALAAAGGKVSLNPDDSDFLQVRFGDKVYDLSGGLANYVRTFMRIGKAGYTKATGTKYEGKKATDKAAASLLMFFRNKFSPNTAYAVDAFWGKAYGQQFDPLEIVHIYPMYTDDVLKALKEDGLLSLATVLLPNIIGVGYGSYASKGQIDSNLETLLQRNMRSSEMNNEKIYNHNKGRTVTKKEFNEFADKRDAEIKKNITKLFNEGALVIDDNDNVIKKAYKDMTPDEVIKETSAIKAAATRKIKIQLFGSEEKSDTRKEAENELRELKKELNPDDENE